MLPLHTEHLTAEVLDLTGMSRALTRQVIHPFPRTGQ